MISRALFKSAHIEWGTPPDLRAALDREFHFTLDPCAPGQVWDGREISWAKHRVFCNPPYSGGKRKRIEPWLQKAREAALAVYLLPSRTDTAWFHDYGLQADEIRFIRGRLRFFEHHALMRELDLPESYVEAIVRRMNSNGQLSGSRLDLLKATDLRKVMVALRKHQARQADPVRIYHLHAA